MLHIKHTPAVTVRFIADESGADIVEYALLAALVGIA